MHIPMLIPIMFPIFAPKTVPMPILIIESIMASVVKQSEILRLKPIPPPAMQPIMIDMKIISNEEIRLCKSDMNPSFLRCFDCNH